MTDLRRMTMNGRTMVSGTDICRRFKAPPELLAALVEETLQHDPDQIGDWICVDDNGCWLACYPASGLLMAMQDRGHALQRDAYVEMYAVFGIDCADGRSFYLSEGM